MSKGALLDVWVGLDGTDFSGVLNEVTAENEYDELDSTTFANAANHRSRDMEAGLVKATASYKGFWTTEEWELARATLGTKQTVLIAQHRAAGAPAFIAKGLAAKMDVGAQVGQMITATGDIAGVTERGFAAGKVLNAWSGTGPATPVAVSASGATVAQQLPGGIASGKAVTACIQVLAVTGTPTLTAKLQSDSASNFPSSADVLTFSAITSTSDPSAQILYADGPITDTWFRLSYTVSGSGTVTFVAAVGRA